MYNNINAHINEHILFGPNIDTHPLGEQPTLQDKY